MLSLALATALPVQTYPPGPAPSRLGPTFWQTAQERRNNRYVNVVTASAVLLGALTTLLCAKALVASDSARLFAVW
jgi:hypothetical protein